MNYVIEKMSQDNAEYYARVNALSWMQSYKGIVNDDYLELINSESEIQKTTSVLKTGLTDGSRRFLLKYNDEYVGILRVRKTKYNNYRQCAELGALYLLDSVKGRGFGKILFNMAINVLKSMGYNKMVIGCLSENPSNGFYKRMGGVLVDTNPIVLPNGQELLENLYYFDAIEL